MVEVTTIGAGPRSDPDRNYSGGFPKSMASSVGGRKGDQRCGAGHRPLGNRPPPAFAAAFGRRRIPRLSNSKALKPLARTFLVLLCGLCHLVQE
ncbi:hypothetical protein Rcae01_04314 [Novipirellula caenicola]|uniref:Uncharacterized protein n=1 Tax=Novipirellula caenicola TaxID=1536901 RepID=A0ABP9VUP3_9BACT